MRITKNIIDISVDAANTTPNNFVPMDDVVKNNLDLIWEEIVTYIHFNITTMKV